MPTTTRQLGFAVTTVVAGTRPELAADLRRFAATVTPGDEVALFLLGSLPVRGDQLYLIAGAPAPDLASRPELLTTEGVEVSDLLRRIGERRPKEVVALIDACGSGEGTGDCGRAAAALPDGVSALVASRRHGGDGRPVARLASLRPDLIPLMRRPGLTFFALYGALGSALAGADVGLSSTPALSRSFTFLPQAAAQTEQAERAPPVQDDARSRPDASQLPADAGEICSSYLVDYFTAWSANNGAALSFMEKAYATSVDYYGKTRTSEEIVEEKKKFVERWPSRTYRVLSGHYDFVENNECHIRVVVDWVASRPSGKKNQGTADFEVTLLLQRKSLIVSKSGKVVSKDP